MFSSVALSNHEIRAWSGKSGHTHTGRGVVTLIIQALNVKSIRSEENGLQISQAAQPAACHHNGTFQNKPQAKITTVLQHNEVTVLCENLDEVTQNVSQR